MVQFVPTHFKKKTNESVNWITQMPQNTKMHKCKKIQCWDKRLGIRYTHSFFELPNIISVQRNKNTFKVCSLSYYAVSRINESYVIFMTFRNLQTNINKRWRMNKETLWNGYIRGQKMVKSVKKTLVLHITFFRYPISI